jgi:hypothetical protein
LARYQVVKIAHSCYEVVLRTTKYTLVYPGSGPSLEVTTSSGLILKMNSGYNGVSKELKKFMK